MKKKLLAGLLSFTVLTAQMLPVIAADDADVVVSENAVVVEETEEEAGQEAEAKPEGELELVSEDEYEEEPVIEESIDAYIVDGKIDKNAIISSLERDGVTILDIYEKDGEVVVETACQVSINNQEAEDFDLGEVEILEAENPYYMYPSNKTYKTYSVGDFDVNGTKISLTATVDYYQTIVYRTRAVKPATDLMASVRMDSGIYNVVKKLMPSGYTFNPDVIKWKFSPKKNKNASYDAKFTVKGTVSSKIAKSMGIKGKDLKLLKKAMKVLNKEMKYVKKKEGIDNRISFTILPLNFDHIEGGMWLTVYYRYGRGGVTYTLSPIYCRLEASQPTTFDKKKWSKIPKKEYKAKILNSGREVEVTPKQKNLIGSTRTFR